jgi:competence protein ComEC
MLATLTVNLWRTSLNGADGLLHLTVLDVGSTSAVLLKTPDGRFLLINGGESANRLGDQLGRRIPPLRRQLDALIVAAPQQNQMEALPRVLEQYPPAYVLWAGNLQASYAASQLQEWLLERQIGIQSALGGETLDLGQGAFLRVLAVSPRGAILSVEWGSFRVILPMGVTYESFEMLENGSRLRGVSALLLAESGYLPANPPLWLENLQPQFFLLSVAAGDLDGLPAPALLETLEGYTLLRTDQNGWIDLATNGQDLWVTVEKEAGSEK